MSATVQCEVTTSADANVVEGQTSAPSTADGRQRLVFGCDLAGRGVSISLKPLTADTQFVLYSMTAYVSASMAGPDDE